MIEVSTLSLQLLCKSSRKWVEKKREFSFVDQKLMIIFINLEIPNLYFSSDVGEIKSNVIFISKTRPSVHLDEHIRYQPIRKHDHMLKLTQLHEV